MRATPTLLVVAALIGAGCASLPDGSRLTTRTAAEGDVANPEGFSEGTGGADGLVLDDEYRPLPGALVTVVDLERNATTAEDGRFQLRGLPPGRLVILASFEGHEPAAHVVQILAGEIAHVMLRLELTRVVNEPYHKTFAPWIGAFGCSSAVHLSRPDFCADLPEAIRPFASNDTAIFPAYEGMTAMQSELVWVPTSSFSAQKMRFYCTIPGERAEGSIYPVAHDFWCQGHKQEKGWRDGFCEGQGRSPVVITCHVNTQADDLPILPSQYNITMGVVVHPDSLTAAINSGQSPGSWWANQSALVLGQRFQFYHTQAYWGIEIPKTFQARPDA